MSVGIAFSVYNGNLTLTINPQETMRIAGIAIIEGQLCVVAALVEKINRLLRTKVRIAPTAAIGKDPTIRPIPTRGPLRTAHAIPIH